MTATVNKQNLLSEEKLELAFNFYDKDKNGSISIDEIKEVLGVGKKIKEEVWMEVIKEVDADGNGEVSY